MHSFLEMYKNSDSLHHAYYFVEHKVEEAIKKLKDFIEDKIGIRTQGNPDFWHQKFENFTIDDARFLIEVESRKPVMGEKKIFLIETNFITEEAQNALLKVFEEPRSGTHFFIISPQDVILPTLRSRLLVFESENNTESSENFLKMNIKEKIDFIKNLTEEIRDEESTKQDAVIFVNKILKKLYEEGVVENSEKIKICELTRKSLFQRGAPIKMILENLVLSI